MVRQLGMAIAAGFALVGTALCVAQSAPATPSPAPCSASPQPAPCAVTPAVPTKPDTVNKFPFPEETTPAVDGSKSAPAKSDPAPDAPGAGKKPGGDFPFPEEDPKAAGSGGSSSSSSSSSSGDSTPFDPDANANGAASKDKSSDGSPAPGRHVLHRVNPIGTKLLSPDERVAEDLDVAHFYSQTGDFQGAYLRSQDAVKTAPDDPETHFALAEAARRLNKRAEAIAEYNACLKLDPIDKQAKAARKELERLKP